ncbi:glycosyltransferase [Alsobacter sp. R-9]
MRSVVAYPGTMDHAQQVALAMHEEGWLEAFVTTFAWKPDSRAAGLVGLLPGSLAKRLGRELGRRAVTAVPVDKVHTDAALEIIRTAASVLRASPILVDRAWDRMIRRFDQNVARRHVEQSDVIQVFEYSGLETLKAARRAGRFSVLHLPSLDSRAFEAIAGAERRRNPELASAADKYFASRFEERYARRCEEIALADLVLTNSATTTRSHVAAGADPAKFVAVPLAAPPPLAAVRDIRRDKSTRLRVLWAGNFTPGKGANHLLEAWTRLPAGHVELHVYGRVPDARLQIAGALENIVFHGSVPRSVLFEAYGEAEVLVFPTLSDGFGMVVAEALAHGLPVITTDQAGAADLLDDTCGLIVPPGDAAALADALMRCLDQREWLAEMRPHALAAAARRQWSDYRRDVRAAIASRLGASPGR